MKKDLLMLIIVVTATTLFGACQYKAVHEGIKQGFFFIDSEEFPADSEIIGYGLNVVGIESSEGLQLKKFKDNLGYSAEEWEESFVTAFNDCKEALYE